MILGGWAPGGSGTSVDYTGNIKKFGGNIFYVSKVYGNDVNDGSSPASAFETIGKAIEDSSAGDGIVVMAGTYTEVGIDVSKNSLELWFEIGAILRPSTGAALTISGDYCRVICPGGALLLDPAEANATGMVISGDFCYVAEVRAKMDSVGDIGFDITGNGADLRRCRCSNPLVAAFKIQGDNVKLEDCCTGGLVANTSYGFWATNSCDKLRMKTCSSQGHSEGGFHLDTGVTNACIGEFSSGGGDGKWVGVDENAVITNLEYEVIKTSTANLDASNETKAYNVAQIYGVVELKNIHITVLQVFSSNIRDFHLDVYDGTNSVAITADTGLTLDNAPVGSLITRLKDSSEVMEYVSGATAFKAENANFREPMSQVIVGQKGDGTATYLRLVYTTTDTPSSGQIRGHIEWSPITMDGFVKVL